MKDQAGAQIVVGCRVTEFNYGDGTVESIEVPARGGSFNVGIKWDDPSKDGPTWSAEGGGRGAQHLLVIEAAPDAGEPAVGAVEMLPKVELFRRRFGRSPTASEAEMEEEEWGEVEDADVEEEVEGGEEGGEEGGVGAVEDSGEEGGETGGEAGGEMGGEDAGKTGGETGSEEAGKESGERGDGAETDSALKALVKTGARVRICLSLPAEWYGALVGEERDDGVNFGFDDGDITNYSWDHLERAFAAKCLAAAPAADGGIIANKSGYALAAAFVKGSFSGKEKMFGLLVGKTNDSIAGMPIYLGFTVVKDLFAPPKRVRRKAEGLTTQDRQGLHTFRRGDLVEYLEAAKDEGVVRAVVFGYLLTEPVPGDNEMRKFLVLYLAVEDVFFLGACPAWRRVPTAAAAEADAVAAAGGEGGKAFDCDDNELVQAVPREQQEAMAVKFRSGGEAVFTATTTRRQVLRKANEAPPNLRMARERAKQEQAEARRRATAAAAAAARQKAEADRRNRQKRDPPPREPPPREPPPREPPPLRDPPPRDRSRERTSPRHSPTHSLRRHQELSPSPPRSVKQLKKIIGGLKRAQSIPGQDPAALAARAQELDGYEEDLAERQRKFRKYGSWDS